MSIEEMYLNSRYLNKQTKKKTLFIFILCRNKYYSNEIRCLFVFKNNFIFLVSPYKSYLSRTNFFNAQSFLRILRTFLY